MEFFWRGFKSSLSSPIKCSNDTLSVRRNKRSTRKKRNSCKQKCLPLDWKTPTGLPRPLPTSCSLEPSVRRHCIPGRCFPFCQTAMMINRDRGALVKFLCPLCPQQIAVQVSVFVCVCLYVWVYLDSLQLSGSLLPHLQGTAWVTWTVCGAAAVVAFCYL